jgi:hypothetical protein
MAGFTRFTWDLARELRMPRTLMLRLMPSGELTGWRAYYTVLAAERDADNATTRS